MTRTLPDGSTVEINGTLLTFALRLDNLMYTRGWSRKDLAKEIDVHINTIANWLTAKTDPGIVRIVQLADLFGVEVNEFFE